MKTKITFTIQGNQDHPHGNPIGYKRMLNHSWRAESTRYANWQSFVRNEYARQTKVLGFPVMLSDAPEAGTKKATPVRQQLAVARANIKPILLEHTKCRMDLKIWWADRTHGDPDNIFKGIADALFKQDKYLDGSFVSDYAPDKRGRVEVTITILKKL